MFNGHKTSISWEDGFWRSLREIARQQKRSVSKLVNEIDAGRASCTNLSSAIRLYILTHYLTRAVQLQAGAGIASIPELQPRRANAA
jgi:predicted DNA-binding ribbon-helix-helix protein